MNRILKESRKQNPDENILKTATSDELLEETPFGQSALKTCLTNHLLNKLPHQFTAEDRSRITDALLHICETELKNPINNRAERARLQHEVILWQKKIMNSNAE